MRDDLFRTLRCILCFKTETNGVTLFICSLSSDSAYFFKRSPKKAHMAQLEEVSAVVCTPYGYLVRISRQVFYLLEVDGPVPDLSAKYKAPTCWSAGSRK